MKTTKKTERKSSPTIPWHVLLIAVYPTLTLLAHNIDQVTPASAALPFILSVVVAGLLLLLARLWLRDWLRAALVTTILLVLFFSYGQVYASLKNVTVSGIYLFRHRTLVPLWVVLAGLGLWWASRRRPQIRGLTRILNVVGVVLLIFPLIQLGSGLWRQVRAAQVSSAPSVPTAAPGGSVAGGALPDIYYIILDAHSRSDELQKIYGYDNSAFIASLRQMGFYVADCSQSNYGQTELSVSSELNYNYLDALGSTFVPTSTDRSPLWPLIKHSAVRAALEQRGYKIVAFKTGFSWTEWTDADLYLAPQLSKWQLDSFQYMWLQTTMGRILLDEEALRALQSPDDLFRQRTLFDLQQLPQLATTGQGPKFVFAHMIIPHPPFVLGPNGEAVSIGSGATSSMASQGYVDQVTYIDKRMLEILPEIIANSSVPPIIIIQGDHGTGAVGGGDHMANLSAFYLPGHESMLYPTITNVNTFRVILDEYFGQNLPLLPDVSLFSDYTFPYNFHQVQSDCSQ